MIERILELVKEKNKIDQKLDWYTWSSIYLKWLKDEIIEVENELKDNNSIYLEDELWDILWDYLNLLAWLEKEWKITSIEKVFSRSEKKYSERISELKISNNDNKHIGWNNVKKKRYYQPNKRIFQKIFQNWKIFLILKFR